MSVPYRIIVRQAALRINAITGTTAIPLESSYSTTSLTPTQFGSAEFPFTSIKDAAISSVGHLVRAYSFVSGHPFRVNNLSQTASVPHKGIMPVADANGKQIVGVYGAIRDAVTFDAMTEQPVQLIENIRANTDLFLKSNYFYYKIVGDRLYHTRTNAVIDVCTFDRAAEDAAFMANGNASIPDALIDAAWCGMVAILVRDDEFANQAALASNYVQNILAEIKQNAINFTPAPTLVNTAEPRLS